MIKKQEAKLKTLEMLVRIKSAILKATDEKKLLQELCIEITQLESYDVAWVVLTNQNQKQIAAFSSDEKVADAKSYRCWKRAINDDGIFMIDRNSEVCSQCDLKKKNGYVMISKRMQFDNEIFGVFSVSLRVELMDDEAKSMFSDLIDDVSTAIYALRLKSEKESFEKQLLESRNMYRHLLETSSIPMAILNLEGRIIFASNSLRKLLGVSKAANLEKKHYYATDFLVDEFKEDGVAWLQKVLEEDILVVNDYIFKSFDNERHHLRSRTSLMRNPEGEPNGFMVVLNDLSSEVKTEEALRLSEEQFRLLFMKAPNGVTLLSPTGVIIDCNEREAEMLQMKRNDLIGQHIKDFLSEEHQRVFDKNFEEFKNTGNKSVIVKLVRLDGQEITVSRSVSALRNKDGSIRGIIVNTRDITEELEARERITLLSLAIEQSPTIFTLTDLNGDIVYVNKKFEEVTGYTKEEAIGLKPSILKSGMLSSRVYEEMWNKLKQGEVWRGELCNRRKDGALYWEYASMSPIRDSNGKLTYMMKVAEDITIRKETERELKEATIRYHNIFELVPTPIVLHRNGIIVDFNQAAFEFTKEKNKEDMLGKHVLNYVHPSSHELLIRRLKVLQRGVEYVPPIEENFMNAEGELRQVIVQSKEFMLKGERVFMVVFEDITERKEAERKLVESEKRFRSFFNMIPDPVTITNMHSGEFIEVNKAALDFLNLSREDIIGKSILAINLYKSEEDRKGLLQELTLNGFVENRELIFTNNNQEATFLVSGRILDSEDGNILMISRDITERKKMEEELIRMKERAEEGERLKASFLSNISHEIRTPMNAILGFSDLLRDPEMEKEQREQYINVIQQRGHDLLKMISNIMDISKIESGSLKIEHKPVVLNEVVRSAMKKLQGRLAKDSSKSLELRCDCRVRDDMMVVGDKYRIQQVLDDLLDNAFKFTSEGYIRLATIAEDDYIRVLLEDTGCGIPTDKQGIIFNRFVQLYDGNDIGIGGAGLGLSISRSLLRMMDATDIEVQSEPGKGSAFSFGLKIYDGAGMSSEEGKMKNVVLFDWSDKTVLVAEDDPSNQMFIKVILSKTNIRLLMANDGLEATEIFEKNAGKIDLVLVDVKMPKINGYELTEYIKSKKPKMPVIALTANAMNNDREEALSHGCDEYLAKPISKDDLFATMEKYL